MAVQIKNDKIITVLCNHPKVEINQPNGNGDTALHIAVKNGDLNTARLLVQHKANIDIKTSETAKEKTPLEIAGQKDDIEMQKFLVLSGAKIDDLLLKAIADHKKAFIQFLLTEAIQFVNPNITSSGGKSALMLSVEKKQTETVSLLLNHPSINIYQPDSEGNKALHYAAKENHSEGVKMLMKKGASIKDKNKFKKTSLQLAQENGHQNLSVWMQDKHHAKKIKPFLKPLQAKLQEQEAEIQALKQESQQQAHILRQELRQENIRLEKTLQYQQIEIENLKKSQSFFTPARKEMIVSKEMKILQKQEAEKKREQEPIYQAARERQRQEEQRCEQIKIKQAPFIAALLKGDMETAIKLESEGASLTEPNAEGMYPLVAAVYGCNLELVRYIEGKLKGGAAEQWQKVDTQEFAHILDSQMPTDLSKNPTYGELGNWYIKYEKASWCVTYDKNVLRGMGCSCWGAGDGKSWGKEGRTEWLLGGGGDGYVVVGGRMRGGKWTGEGLYSPSVKVHDDVVKAIREQLNELSNEVKTKCQKSFNAGIK